METEFDSRDYVLTNKFLEDFVLKVYHLQILVSIHVCQASTITLFSAVAETLYWSILRNR